MRKILECVRETEIAFIKLVEDKVDIIERILYVHRLLA